MSGYLATALRVLTLSFIFSTLVAAAPEDVTLANGLQDQKPAVARVGQSWTFELLSDTFTSDEDLTYNASGLPSWASFDSAALSFSGQPSSDDKTTSRVTVTASSSSGSSTSDGFDLLVSDNSAPKINTPVSKQLPNASSLAPECVLEWSGALRIPPNQNFTMQFDLDTFKSDDSSSIFYDCFTKGNTTMPDWLAFDNSTLSFAGTTPSQGSKWDFVLSGSDVYGYGDVEQQFTISVDAHNFDLLQPLPALNATPGGEVNYTVALANIEIDHIDVVPQNITIPEIDLSALPGLNFTADDRLISGTLSESVDASASNLSIPITLKSSYSQHISTSIKVNLVDPLFSARDLPDLQLPYGKDFSKDLSTYFSDKDADYSAEISPSQSVSWLHYDASKKLLTGTAPQQDKDQRKRADAQDAATVDFSAYDSSTGIRDTASMKVSLSQGVNEVHEEHHSGLSRGATIAVACVFGILGGLALLALLVYLCLCCCRRRKARQDARSSPPHSMSGGITSDLSFTMISLPFKPNQQSQEKAKQVFERDAVVVAPPVSNVGSANPPAYQKEGSEQQRDNTCETLADTRRMTRVDPLGISGLDMPHAGAKTTFEASSSTEGFQQVDASTWGSSNGSTSIFYSEEGSSNDHSSFSHGGYNHSPPRQRSDFRPSDCSGESRRKASISSATSWISTGIRYISGGRTQEEHFTPGGSPSSHPPPRPTIAQPRLVTLKELSLNRLSDASNGQLSPAMIPASPLDGSSPQLNSQPLLRTEHDDSSFDDAPEELSDTSRFSTASYEPDRSLEVAHSAIFFHDETPNTTQSEWSDSCHECGPTIRPVSQYTPRKQSMVSERTTDTLEANHMAVDIGLPFHFTPSLQPPPQLASPTRGGPPSRRSTYVALTWEPDSKEQTGKPLPDWLHFSEEEMEFVRCFELYRSILWLTRLPQWGIPPAEEYGCTIGVQVVEHKNHSRVASPTDRRYSHDGNVVCRLFVDVLDRRSSTKMPAQETFRTLTY